MFLECDTSSYFAHVKFVCKPCCIIVVSRCLLALYLLHLSWKIHCWHLRRENNTWRNVMYYNTNVPKKMHSFNVVRTNSSSFNVTLKLLKLKSWISFFPSSTLIQQQQVLLAIISKNDEMWFFKILPCSWLTFNRFHAMILSSIILCI